MKCEATRGFTLIELLVVVLIIGILAAVALPQYQKAVEKSKASVAFSTIRVLQSGVESYVLSHGFPTKRSDFSRDFLDIDVEDDTNWTYDVIYSSDYFVVTASSKQDLGYGFAAYYDGTSWNLTCEYSRKESEKNCELFTEQGWQPSDAI